MRKNQFSVSGEGLYYIFILLFIVSGAFLREINLLLMLTGMMIGLLVFNYYVVTTTLFRLRVRRQLPERICAGDLLIVELALTNDRVRSNSWVITVEDRIRRIEAGDKGQEVKKVSLLGPRIRAGQSVPLSYRGRLMQRGHYAFGPVRIATRFPLGLVRRSIQLEGVDRLVVYPRLGTLTNQWTQLIQARRVGSRHTRHRHGLVEGDFYGLREWRKGDSRRWIHWRTSAKRGSLKIRQFEQQRNLNVALLLDLWQPNFPTNEQTDRCELAITFAATAMEELCRRGGSQLLLGTAGKTVTSLRGAASMGLLYEMMDQLAGVYGDSQDRLPELLVRGLEEVHGNMKTILISTRPTDLQDTERFAEIWSDPVKRHSLCQIVCLDVSSDEVVEYFIS